MQSTECMTLYLIIAALGGRKFNPITPWVVRCQLWPTWELNFSQPGIIETVEGKGLMVTVYFQQLLNIVRVMLLCFGGRWYNNLLMTLIISEINRKK